MSSTAIERPARVAIEKPRVHQLVGEDHRLAQPAAAESRVDELGDFLLLERLVDELERQPRRQDLGQQRAADGRLVARDLLASCSPSSSSSYSLMRTLIFALISTWPRLVGARNFRRR